MIICNTTYNVNGPIVNEWIHWIKEKYVPKIMSLGFFVESQLLKVLVEEEMGGETYCLQFYAADMETYKKFEHEHVGNYDAMLLKKYQGKVVMFRTLMEKL